MHCMHTLSSAPLVRRALREVGVDVELLVERLRGLVVAAVAVEGHGLDERPHLGVVEDVAGVLQVVPVVAVDDDLGGQAPALKLLGELLDLAGRNSTSSCWLI